MTQAVMTDEAAREHAELLAKMQQRVAAPEPGDFLPGTVIDTKETGETVPMIASSLSSPGYAYIWDTKSGEQSRTSVNMLPAQLKKKRDDGTLIFTTIDPHITPARGNCKCLLHEDDPHRSRYQAWGFVTCRKANLANRFEVEAHMKARHKREWAAIQANKEEIEKEEQRQFQKAWMAAELRKAEPEKARK